MSIRSFFAPKRKAEEGVSEVSPAKKPKEETATSAGAVEASDPETFVAWNSNSLISRLKKNKQTFVSNHDDIKEYLRREEWPDVICLTETWLKASSDMARGVLASSDKRDREERELVHNALSSGGCFQGYTAFWSCNTQRRAGSGMLIKKGIKPLSMKYTLEPNARPSQHQREGRVILAEFKTFRLLLTYVPNNTWDEKGDTRKPPGETGMPRRIRWDEEIRDFFLREKNGKPIVWTGDLNVSHLDIDVCSRDKECTGAEWFSKQFPSKFTNPGYVPPKDPNNKGQPGFTPNERKRFTGILEDGNMLDALRELHPDKLVYSWRGDPGVNQPGRYRGCAMRLDYWLLHKTLRGRLVECRHSEEVLNEEQLYRMDPQGYLGSDHCPVYLRLKPESEA